MKISTLTNGQLLNLCRKYGAQAKLWRQKFIGLLPKSALETLVRDEKRNVEFRNPDAAGQADGLQEPLLDGEAVPGHELKFEIADDVKREFNELYERGIDVNALLREMLKKRRSEIAREKEELSAQAEPTESRYIPVKIREVLKREFGDKCSIRGCNKPSAQIHHTQRFSLGRMHDPKFLAPLCKEHHAIAHCIVQKYFLAKETAKL